MNPNLRAGSAGDGFSFSRGGYNEEFVWPEREQMAESEEIHRMWKDRMEHQYVVGAIEKAKHMNAVSVEVVDFVVEYMNMVRENCLREQEEQLSQNSNNSHNNKYPSVSSVGSNEPTLFDYPLTQPCANFAASSQPAFTLFYEKDCKSSDKKRSVSDTTDWTTRSTGSSISDYYRNDTKTPEWIERAAKWISEDDQ